MSRRGRADPSSVVASFDSATVLHAAVAAALRGEPFPHLGNGVVAAAAVRAVGRLPWAVLRHLYTRVGSAEALPVRRLAEVDMAAVAAWLAGGLPRRRYPAAMIGSSNGALAHLAAAMQVPWLPGTLLVPVARVADPHRPDAALEFGRRYAPAFLDANQDVVLHHMHDQLQDELMVSRMTYFRPKWRTLPAAYGAFLADNLAPGAPVLLVEDRSRWPVVRVAENHVFQPGAQGGVPPEGYLQRRHTPSTDDEAAEAEWGAEPGLGASVAAWCARQGHPLVRIAFDGPQAPAHAVAEVIRGWYRERDEPADRLLVPSFVLGDPWRTLMTGAVPYWTFFSVRPALTAFEEHLRRSERYREVDLLLFQHGVWSPGIAAPHEWEAVARRHGATPRLLAVDPARFPHDVAAMARYGSAMANLPSARSPWSPLDLRRVLAGLAAGGVDVSGASLPRGGAAGQPRAAEGR